MTWDTFGPHHSVLHSTEPPTVLHAYRWWEVASSCIKSRVMSLDERDALIRSQLTDIFNQMEVACEVVECPTAGKGVRALADIPQGTALFEEVPLVSWPLSCVYGKPYCRQCLRMISLGNIDRFQCPESQVPFCSEECRATAMRGPLILLRGMETRMHEFQQRIEAESEDEFPITIEALAKSCATLIVRYERGAARNPGATVSELFAAAAVPFNRFIEPPTGTKFDGIDLDLWIAEVRGLLFEKCASSCGVEVAEAILGKSTQATLLGQLTLNSHALNIQSTAPDGTSIAPTVGAGVFSLQSCFNHDCEPNCRVKFTDSHEISVQAIKEIRQGDWLTITYIPELFIALETVEQIQERLRPYYFTCKCKRCTTGQRTS